MLLLLITKALLLTVALCFMRADTLLCPPTLSVPQMLAWNATMMLLHGLSFEGAVLATPQDHIPLMLLSLMTKGLLLTVALLMVL